MQQLANPVCLIMIDPWPIVAVRWIKWEVHRSPSYWSQEDPFFLRWFHRWRRELWVRINTWSAKTAKLLAFDVHNIFCSISTLYRQVKYYNINSLMIQLIIFCSYLMLQMIYTDRTRKAQLQNRTLLWTSIAWLIQGLLIPSASSLESYFYPQYIHQLCDIALYEDGRFVTKSKIASTGEYYVP
jgi:hypothetical protein